MRGLSSRPCCWISSGKPTPPGNCSKSTRRNRRNPPPSFFYHLGDVVYFTGARSSYYDQFYDPYLHYAAPIFAIPGNHDGDLDILLTSNGGPAELPRNDSAPRRHWLQVELEGSKSNRDGLGAEVIVTAGGRAQRQWARSGSSYCSASMRRLHFGPAAPVDQLQPSDRAPPVIRLQHDAPKDAVSHDPRAEIPDPLPLLLEHKRVSALVQAKVWRKIKDNRFAIRTSAPNVEVSWQVTGIRNDPAARRSLQAKTVEQPKVGGAIGKYLAPELYGQPQEMAEHRRPLANAKPASREQVSQNN